MKLTQQARDSSRIKIGRDSEKSACRSLVEIRKRKTAEKQHTCHALVKYVMDRMEIGDARSLKP